MFFTQIDDNDDDDETKTQKELTSLEVCYRLFVLIQPLASS